MKAVGEPIPMPVPCVCPDPVGKASGTIPVTEDDGWYYMPPPTGPGNGPFVPVVVKNINNGLPFWEEVANLVAAAVAAQSRKG